MNKIIIETDSDNKDQIKPKIKRFEFEFYPDVDIYEFNNICRKIAYCLGYHNDTIKEVFGND